MAIHHGTRIVRDGLAFNMDFADRLCYDRNSSICRDFNSPDIAGEIVGSPTFVVDSCGGYFHFDGLTKYIKIPNNNASLNSQNLSFEVWLKLDYLSSYSPCPAGGDIIYIFHKEGQYSIHQWGGNIRCAQGRTITSTALNIQPVLMIPAMNTSSWYQVVYTVDTNTSLFVNCEYKGSSATNPGTNGPIVSDTQGISIGCAGGYSGSPAGFYYGSIAISRVYNRVLSNVEIAQNYKAVKTRFGLS